MSIRLYIGNLPKELERQELEEVFAEENSNTVSTKIITDRKTGKCRGFGFVTVQTDEQADEIIEKYNGYTLKDSTLKIEKALPRTKGSKAEDGEGDDGADQEAPSGAGNRKRATKQRRTGGGAVQGTKTSSDATSFQPDPRWAGKLEKLKAILATTQAPEN